MKIVILSASPKKDASITLQIGRLIQKVSELSVKDEFSEFMIGDGKYTKEIGEKIKEADLVMFCSSIFHFNVHQQLMCFLDDMEADLGNVMIGKPVTYFTTSAHLLDTEPHFYMETRLSRMGAYFIRSLSMLDNDMLQEERREEVANWYMYVRSCAMKKQENFKSKESKICLLDVSDGTNPKIREYMDKVKAKLLALGAGTVTEEQVRGHNIHPCCACSCCYIDGNCVMKDDYNALADAVYRKTDSLIIFGDLQYGILGKYQKLWLDRHVQYGLYPHFCETICGYVIDSSKSNENDLMEFKIHSRANDNFGGEYHVGIYEMGDEAKLDAYCQDIAKIYNYELYPQRNFYQRATYEKFKWLCWDLQAITARKNFAFYSHDGNGYKWPELNPNIQRFYDYKGAIEAEKSRLIPYKMILSSLNEDISLKTKRRANSAWFSDDLEKIHRGPDYSDEEQKKGFFAKLFGK